MIRNATIVGLTALALCIGATALTDRAEARSAYDDTAVSQNYRAYYYSWYERYYGNNTLAASGAVDDAYRAWYYSYYGRQYNYRPYWNLALDAAYDGYSAANRRTWWDVTEDSFHDGYIYTWYAHYYFR